MKSSLSVLAALALSTLTTAQIPSCAVACIASAVSSATKCGATDLVCQCQPAAKQAIGQAAEACVLTACGETQALNVLAAANAACSAALAGASIPIPPTPVPTATPSDISIPLSEPSMAPTESPGSSSLPIPSIYPGYTAPATSTVEIESFGLLLPTASPTPLPSRSTNANVNSTASASTAAGNGNVNGTATATTGMIQVSAGAGTRLNVAGVGGVAAVGMAVFAAF